LQDGRGGALTDTNRSRRVGYIGAGLMGHGAAKNLLKRGHALTLLAHRKRPAVEDLIAQGASEAPTPADVARASEVVFLCLPSSVEVEQVLTGPDGVAAGAKRGLIIVDSTTADPVVTRRLAAWLAERGVSMIDAPLGRSPAAAEAGKLASFVGGDPGAIARVRDLIACYSEVIIETGPIGSATTCKILNNFMTVSNAAVVAEAVACAAALGIDLQKFYEIVSASGANSSMFQQMMPWALRGDVSPLRGAMRLAVKDLGYYDDLTRDLAARPISPHVIALYRRMEAEGHRDRFLPELIGLLARENGAEVQPLDEPPD
jgi:3-hydroxyisobutyrate dehydrogenase-like beta-hydroxyacid dehydrogenase